MTKNVVIHQPQFLPYAGFWNRYLASDVYVFYAGVKFNQAGHQHRVTVNGNWMTLPVEHHSRSRLIKDVRLADGYQSVLNKMAVTIQQTCMAKKSPFGERLEPLVNALEMAPTSGFMLDVVLATHFCLEEILGIKDGPEPRLDTEERPDLGKLDKLMDCIELHTDPDDELNYLSGAGGKGYLTYDSLGIPTFFQKQDPHADPDSVVQLIALAPDPLAVIKNAATWVDENGVAHQRP